MYAAALIDAGNPDVNVTSKSYVCQAVFAAMYEGSNKRDVMTRLLREMTGFQLGEWNVKYLLAKGCKMTHDMLEKELDKVLDLEMPAAYFQGEIEKQKIAAAVQDWMDEFEVLSAADSDDDFGAFHSIDSDDGEDAM